MASHTIALGNVTSLVSKAIHPYYPLDAEIVGYAANEWSVPALLGVFFGVCAALFSATFFVAKKINPALRKDELITIMWFVLSGSIHVFFEGYYAANWATLGSKQTLIGQMWKEYAFSDSRYLTRNTMVLCMEAMTAMCWGPGCLLIAWYIITNNPLRYPVQLVVSVGQFYGDALYYATSFFDHYVMGVSYSRPEAVYYWCYFILMNLFWIVIPGGGYKAQLHSQHS
jgi:cholestenol Delta-isomerase